MNNLCSSPTTVPSNFQCLAGAVTLGRFNADAFDTTCAEMKKLGFSSVYFGDIFFETFPAGTSYSEEELVFAEDDTIFLARPKEQLKKIKDILQRHDLTVPSSHFLQSMPPPGEAAEWIFPWHKRLLDVAAFLGMERVTTHIGSMLGIACERYLGEHALQFQQGKLSFIELVKKASEIHGEENFLPDSLKIYRKLCSAAATRGIQITVETAVYERPEICCQPDQLVAFVQEVGADNLGICLDAGHCNFQHVNTKEMIQKAGPLLFETHFHDNFADIDSHYPVGIGTANWREIIQEMVAIDYPGIITFEQGHHAVNATNWRLFVEAVEKDADRVRKMQ